MKFLCIFIFDTCIEHTKLLTRVFCAAISGVVAYNNHKLKKEASPGSSKDLQPEESIPMVSSSPDK